MIKECKFKKDFNLFLFTYHTNEILHFSRLTIVDQLFLRWEQFHIENKSFFSWISSNRTFFSSWWYESESELSILFTFTLKSESESECIPFDIEVRMWVRIRWMPRSVLTLIQLYLHNILLKISRCKEMSEIIHANMNNFPIISISLIPSLSLFEMKTHFSIDFQKNHSSINIFWFNYVCSYWWP